MATIATAMKIAVPKKKVKGKKTHTRRNEIGMRESEIKPLRFDNNFVVGTVEIKKVGFSGFFFFRS
jgi:hypothetical protein